jgi:hypothetical protein
MLHLRGMARFVARHMAVLVVTSWLLATGLGGDSKTTAIGLALLSRNSHRSTATEVTLTSAA